MFSALYVSSRRNLNESHGFSDRTRRPDREGAENSATLLALPEVKSYYLLPLHHIHL
jgi:hypothetical protein